MPIGVVVAAAATATGSPHLVGEGRRFGAETWARISAAGRGVRALAGVVLVVVAYALVRYRDGIVPALLTIAGALVGYVGVVTFLDAVLGARVDAAAERDEEARRRHRRLERLRTAGVGVVVAALVVGAVVAGGVAIARARDALEPTPSCVATGSPSCAIAASTRWRSPARTTRCRRPTTPAGSSPRT